ncbi:MAG TPA: nuclear transport factor 2 family protein, partial [Burkholderiales bacterium]|nr:nuclear transport factor 2 family protein [Burkholderiales bacterium]
MDKDAIRRLEDQRYKAMCEADAATLEKLLADSLVYTHSYGGADSKASYLDGIRSKKWQYRKIERPKENIQ